MIKRVASIIGMLSALISLPTAASIVASGGTLTDTDNGLLWAHPRSVDEFNAYLDGGWSLGTWDQLQLLGRLTEPLDLGSQDLVGFFGPPVSSSGPYTSFLASGWVCEAGTVRCRIGAIELDNLTGNSGYLAIAVGDAVNSDNRDLFSYPSTDPVVAAFVVQPVPLPATLLLFASGLAFLCVYKTHRLSPVGLAS